MARIAVWRLLKDSFRDWSEDQAPRLAAALAYYTVFSLAPVLVIVVAVAGLAFGSDQVRSGIVEQVRGMLGDGGADLVLGMLEAAAKPKDSLVAVGIAFATMVIGASGLFAQLQDALNTVWEVRPKAGRGLIGMVKDRFLSFSMVLGVGFLLLVSLVLAAALQAVQTFAEGRVSALTPAFQGFGLLLDLGLTALLFAMLFKFLPDVKLKWSDVWTGAVITAILFAIGKWTLGAYLGRGAVGSAYGAAGSLAIVLIWVYYSAQILLFGAEVTQAYAKQRGSWVEPKENAEPAPGKGHGDRTGAAVAPASTPAAPRAPSPAAIAPAARSAALRTVEAEVVPSSVRRPPAFLGGVALGIVFGFVNDKVRRRLTPSGRWRP
jgi:membrane protein